jgi:glycosyltransferase involved in cell wall biosynthesis
MNKELWIFNHYARTGEDAGGARHFEMAKHLIKRGWSVTIFASGITHRTGKNLVKADESRAIKMIEGVRFVWLKASPYKGNGLSRWKNIVEYYLQAIKVKQTIGLGKPDVVIGSSVHPLAGLAAWHVASRFSVPFVFEVRDLWPQTLIDMGKISKRSPIALVLRKLEVFLYKKAKRIISVLPGAADYIEKSGISPEKVVWISNGVNIDSYQTIELPASKESFELMYLGSLGEANAIEILLDAMKLVSDKNPKVILRIVGTGPREYALKEQAKKLGLLNKTVRFEGVVPRSEVAGVAEKANAFVITVKDVPGLYRYGISMNKIFDYMAAGKPTVIAIDAFNNPIAESGGGITVKPDDPCELAKAILALVAMPDDKRERMGTCAREHAEKLYSYEHLAHRLESMLVELQSN